MFPSPCGDMVLKLLLRSDSDEGVRKFPSPYGDMVLKWIGTSTFATTSK